MFLNDDSEGRTKGEYKNSLYPQLGFVIRTLTISLLLNAVVYPSNAQNSVERPDISRMQSYKSHRSSSSDPLGGNADSRQIPSGGTLTLLDTDGPGTVTHVWLTLSNKDAEIIL